MDVRSPVLEYATEHPVTAYTDPVAAVDPSDTMLTEDGSFDVITEDSFTIGLDPELNQ